MKGKKLGLGFYMYEFGLWAMKWWLGRIFFGPNNINEYNKEKLRLPPMKSLSMIYTPILNLTPFNSPVIIEVGFIFT
jgi:hypothetical protein